LSRRPSRRCAPTSGPATTCAGLFEQHDAILLGITVDNIPTLFAWTQQMGSELWFPVLSDFWPHGAVASKYGLLRSDGVSERALIFIDKRGIIRDILITDINKRPTWSPALSPWKNSRRNRAFLNLRFRRVTPTFG